MFAGVVRPDITLLTDTCWAVQKTQMLISFAYVSDVYEKEKKVFQRQKRENKRSRMTITFINEETYEPLNTNKDKNGRK